MILWDYSNGLIKAIFTQGIHGPEGPTVETLRPLLLTQIKSLKMKFSKDYGRFVICMDGRNNWRKKAFKHYKYRRSIGREESDLDWGALFAMSDEIIEGFKEYLPYQILRVEGCEADDLIGYLASNTTDPTVVCSSDKDFKQLLQFDHVKWFSLYHKVFMKCDDPLMWLEEEIIRGQKKDDIPNILAAEDHFVKDEKPQPRITQKFLTQCFTSEPEKFCKDKATLDRYNQNRELLDLTAQPDWVKERMEKAIAEPYLQSNQKIYKYFSKHRLRLFMRKNLNAFCEDFK